MLKKSFKKGQLYINYLGPFSSVLGSIVATPVLISNLGLTDWSLFALVNILLPLVYLVLFGSDENARRLMINVFLGNNKTFESIKLFYKNEKKIFIKFICSILIFSTILTILNSHNYPEYKEIRLTFFLISVAVFINLFGFYYSELLNGLKQHYRLHVTGFIITVFKWSTIIYVSFQNNTSINTFLIIIILFSFLLIFFQRIFLLVTFKKKLEHVKYQNIKVIKYKFHQKDFGITIFLFLILQQFHKILTFGILDPISISYFGIAFMLSASIPLIISPILGYLIPEIYEQVEKNSINRKKLFFKLLFTQFITLVIFFIVVNFYLDKIIYIWLGSNIDVSEISSFLIPLSIIALSISIFNSLKIFFIAENKITVLKNKLIFIFYFFVILTIGVYKKYVTIEIYLYFYSISMLLLIIYFCSIFFIKKVG